MLMIVLLVTFNFDLLEYSQTRVPWTKLTMGSLDEGEYDAGVFGLR